MQRFFSFLFIILSLLFSCGDGDIITLKLEFDEDLELCGNIDETNYDVVDDPYIIYDIKNSENAFESLILVIPGNVTNDLIFFPEENDTTKTLSINGSTQFNYRIYNGDPYDVVCEAIPSADVKVVKDYPASSGTITSFEDLDGARTVTISFTVRDFDIEVLNSTELYIGTYVQSYPTPN